MASRKRGSKRGFGTIYQKPNSRHWTISYYYRGTQVKETVKSTDRADAVALLKKRLGTPLQPAADATVADILALVVPDYRRKGQHDGIRDVQRHVNELSTVWGADCKAATLTVPMVKRWVDQQLNAKEPRKPATINNYLATLRRAFTLAVEDGYLTHTLKMPKLPTHNERQGFINPDAIDEVLPMLPAELRDVVEWAYVTGMRPKEFKRLRWDMYDARTRLLSIPSKSTKNRKPRILPMVGRFGAIIDRRWQVRSPRVPFIFYRVGDTQAGHFRPFKSGPRPIKDFRYAWKTACAKAGVPDLLLYDMRRSAVRNLIRAGVEKKVAKRISGHVTDSVFDRYNITDEADLVAAAGALDAFLDGQASSAG